MASILLVEDDNFTRELYNQILSAAGHQVAVVKDGEEGWEKASHGGYDLILLDILMPRLDGLSLLKRLKQLEPQPANKKIVMLTVMSNDQIIKEAMQVGADGYLIKSALTPDQVVAEVNNFLLPP